MFSLTKHPSSPHAIFSFLFLFNRARQRGQKLHLLNASKLIGRKDTDHRVKLFDDVFVSKGMEYDMRESQIMEQKALLRAASGGLSDSQRSVASLRSTSSPTGTPNLARRLRKTQERERKTSAPDAGRKTKSEDAEDDKPRLAGRSSAPAVVRRGNKASSTEDDKGKEEDLDDAHDEDSL